MRVLGRLLAFLGYLVERKRAIRRFIVLTVYPVWLYLSVCVLLGVVRVDEWVSVVYGTFSSVVAVVVGFYFHGRGRTDGEKDFCKGKGAY